MALIVSHFSGYVGKRDASPYFCRWHSSRTVQRLCNDWMLVAYHEKLL